MATSPYLTMSTSPSSPPLPPITPQPQRTMLPRSQQPRHVHSHPASLNPSTSASPAFPPHQPHSQPVTRSPQPLLFTADTGRLVDGEGDVNVDVDVDVDVEGSEMDPPPSRTLASVPSLSTDYAPSTSSSKQPPATPLSAPPPGGMGREKERENETDNSARLGSGSGLGLTRSGKEGFSAASSTTSMNGLLGMSMSMTGTGGGASGPNTTATAVTPQTGASKMAAAAAAKRRGDQIEGLTSLGGGIGRELRWNDDEHPLSDKSLEARDYHTIQTMSHLFHLPRRWRLLRPLGQGAYGLVISVRDDLSGEPVAVKCITRVFDKVILARRALREITLLRHFGDHENLTGLIDLDHVWDGYNEIYLYMEPMEADLHQIVRSGQPLSTAHVQYFLYQLLRGMKYIHSANVIHRDLKPGNLLVNSDCELKICDFGLARGYRTGPAAEDDPRLTEYVATRWYRAPEVMLSNRQYTTAIDVWSIGCILAELLGGKPLFKGKDYVDQLNLIIGILGTPDDETLDRVGSEKACAYIRTLPFAPRVPFDQILPEPGPAAVDLLNKLLAFDPDARITVAQAITHPYVGAYHEPSDEPDCHAIFDKWEDVESLETIEQLRDAITREIREFRAEVRDVVFSDEEDRMLDDQDRDETGADTIGSKPVQGLVGATLVASPLPAHDDEESAANLTGVMPSLSPQRMATEIVGGTSGVSPMSVPSVPLPQTGDAASRKRERDASPITPATAISDESFGHLPGSGVPPGTFSGRSSRRSSSHLRRPTSFLFGAGMTPLSTLTSLPGTTGVPAHTAGTSGFSGSGAPQPINTASPMHGLGLSGSALITSGVPGSAETNSGPSSTLGGRRSRAPSASAGIDTAALGKLIRRLSTANLHDLRDAAEEVPPMTVSPSDAPPSEVPKTFGQ